MGGGAKGVGHFLSFVLTITVNPENFARNIFSRMALEDIFATFKIRD